jgi:endo-1,4-beta-xylanase
MTTLKEAAAAVGLNIGIATNSNQVRDASSGYATAAKTQFNMVVCENEMKFESTERTIGQFSYTGGDGVATFAAANQMKMRGHTFIWHSQSGSAQNAIRDRASGLKIMRDHIEAVGGHFKEKIHEWDVLNEITADGSGGLRGTFWRTNIGDDYADSALAMSRRVIGTNGHLYYNDYGADGINTKSTSIYNLAKKWQTNKVPIDGIGLQAHLGTGLNKQSISDNIKRYGEIGLRVSLTEIDITNSKTADWVNLLNACLENFNCVSFVAWGLADGNSWLGSRCGGCLLYSGSGNSAQPKTEIIQALIEAMAKADPAIVAKRKSFAAILPGSLGQPGGVGTLQRPVDRRAAKNLSLLGSTPVFSIGSGAVVDPLGRAKPAAPARIDALEILPR